jgi:hypothetical protein
LNQASLHIEPRDAFALEGGLLYGGFMAKDAALGIRLEPDERDALERASKADERALSAMGRKIIVEWLRTNGWMPERRAVPRDSSRLKAPVENDTNSKSS